MDHKYIDQHDIAGRYLRKELPAGERDEFQAHMVDCAECADRVLLAEMFAAEKNGTPAPAPAPEIAVAQPVPAFLAQAAPPMPLRARIVAHLTPWQLAILLSIILLIFGGIFAGLYWWEIQGLKPPR
ncbi:MAG: zf-HC2 domain-containing protein [Acidobacteriota bacterium]